jgi:ribonuclease E
LVIRTLRDVLTNDVQRIIVDDVNAAQRAKDFLRIAMPRASVKVIHYDRPVPLLDAFDIERQIETINSRTVPLPSGGSLVVDTTEALVAIDVNSGKSRDNKDAETTAYETNKEAVDEIARQLRLRDLGGVVVLDLIDMYQNKHRRDIERRFRDCLKKDRARSKITRINEIGLLSMTRQRMRPSLKKSLHQSCSRCSGTGTVKTAESVALDVMRRLAVVLSCDDVARVELRVSASVGAMLLNRKRHALHMLEEHLGKPIEFKFDADLESDTLELVALDGRGVQMDLEKLPRPKKPKFTDSDEVQAGAGMDVDESDVDDTEDTDDEQADEARGRKQGDSGKQEKQSQQDQQAQQDGDDESGGKRKRRRRRRGGRGRRKRSGNGDQQNGDQQKDEQSKDDSDDQNQSKSDRQSQGSDSSEKTDTKQSDDSNKDEQAGDDGNDDQDEKPKRRRRRRGGRGRRKKDDQNQPDEQAQQDQADDSKDSGKADDGRKQPSDQNGKQAAAKDEQAKQDKPQKSDDQSKSESADDSGSKDNEKQESKPKPRRRRRKTTKSAKADSSDDKSDDKSESAEASTEKQEEQVS